MRLGPSDTTPIYLQVVGLLVEDIAAGRLADGGAAPSVRQLAAELRVNYHTVARAFQVLEEGGLLARRRGGPYVVTDGAGQQAASRLVGEGVAELCRRAAALEVGEAELVERVREELRRLRQVAGRSA